MGHIMMRFAATLVALSFVVLGEASASSNVGVLHAAGNIESRPTVGLLVRNAVLAGTDGRRELRGEVCRAPSRIATGRVGLQLVQRDASGRLVQNSRLQLPTTLGTADRACAAFAIPMAQDLAAGDSVRVCADRAGGAQCPAANN